MSFLGEGKAIFPPPLQKMAIVNLFCRADCKAIQDNQDSFDHDKGQKSAILRAPSPLDFRVFSTKSFPFSPGFSAIQ